MHLKERFTRRDLAFAFLLGIGATLFVLMLSTGRTGWALAILLGNAPLVAVCVASWTDI